MRKILAAQQLSFYTKNGSIELEIGSDIPFSEKRDQWREDAHLLAFIKKELAPLALELSGKKQLRLILSFWIQPPHKNCLLKEMISIQGAQIVIAFSPDPKMPVKRFPLGILPFPSEAKHALFFDPRLILDWEHTSSKVFFLVFGLTHSVYIENKQDPNTHYLKAFHYSFGDLLKSQTHPLIS